jgi:hypothetical protein
MPKIFIMIRLCERPSEARWGSPPGECAALKKKIYFERKKKKIKI